MIESRQSAPVLAKVSEKVCPYKLEIRTLLLNNLDKVRHLCVSRMGFDRFFKVPKKFLKA